MKKVSYFLYLITFTFLVSSCSQKLYKEYNLFQKGLDSLKAYDYKAPLIQNNDLMVIQIFSATLSQEQAIVFNLGTGLTGTGLQSYLVDVEGYINLPIIGKVKSTGLTTDQLSKELKTKLGTLIKDPIVVVNFSSIKINIIGEVKAPGTKVFNTPKPTIIDALSQAGDFTDRAKRSEIYLIRDINGNRTTFKLNLNDASVFDSEAYQLLQNDLVYVPADNIKLKQVNQDPDLAKKLQITSMVVTIISSAAIIINTIFLLKKL